MTYLYWKQIFKNNKRIRLAWIVIYYGRAIRQISSHKVYRVVNYYRRAFITLSTAHKKLRDVEPLRALCLPNLFLENVHCCLLQKKIAKRICLEHHFLLLICSFHLYIRLLYLSICTLVFYIFKKYLCLLYLPICTFIYYIFPCSSSICSFNLYLPV